MGRSYTYQDICAALHSAGIGEGDSLFIHSNIGFFGTLEGANDPAGLCGQFVGAIREVLGKEGTLIVPTFTYSFCHAEIFDPDRTASGCGLLAEYVRTIPGALRSMDPNFSVAAMGRLAKYYTDAWPHEAFGADSFWERLLKQNGRIACFNFDGGSTFVHYVERCCNVPYRYNKAFNGVMIQDGKEYRDYAVHYVYAQEHPEDGPYFERLDKLLREQAFCHRESLGRGSILSFPVKEYKQFIEEILAMRPRFLTKGE